MSDSYHRCVIDEGTEFGARVARHLRDEIVVWLTTVTPAGAPVPAPVWFLWDGADAVTMYSLPGARVRKLEATPRVTLNFAGDERGGDIVVVAGHGTIDRDAPSADHAEAYPMQIWGFEDLQRRETVNVTGSRRAHRAISRATLSGPGARCAC
jgi:PPOX class probable F420-dependent enzyme